jgi:hypothetical protein
VRLVLDDARPVCVFARRQPGQLADWYRLETVERLAVVAGGHKRFGIVPARKQYARAVAEWFARPANEIGTDAGVKLAGILTVRFAVWT